MVLGTYVPHIIEYLRIRCEAMRIRVEEFSAEFPDSEADGWDKEEEAAGTVLPATSPNCFRTWTKRSARQRTGLPVSPAAGVPTPNMTSTCGIRSPAVRLRRLGVPWPERRAHGPGPALVPGHLHFTRDTLIGIPEAGWKFVKDLGVFMAFHGADKRGVARKGLYRLSENVLVFAGAH